MEQQTRTCTGALPLSAGASLTWLAFADSMTPVSMDSQNVLHIYSHAFGGTWVPAFERDATEVNHQSLWPVSVEKGSFCFIACETAQYPQVRTPHLFLSLPAVLWTCCGSYNLMIEMLWGKV